MRFRDIDASLLCYAAVRLKKRPREWRGSVKLPLVRMLVEMTRAGGTSTMAGAGRVASDAVERSSGRSRSSSDSSYALRRAREADLLLNENPAVFSLSPHRPLTA